jgi:hypothetical protein
MSLVGLSFLLYISLLPGNKPDVEPVNPGMIYYGTGIQDTIDIQTLYNGRVWRNLYSRVVGDQFLFTTDFLPGSVTIDDRLYSDLPIKYDIYNDQILTVTDLKIIIELNKEMIDCFTISHNNKKYDFLRIIPDSLTSLDGYYNVMYDGNLSLYLKYKKEILPLEVEHKYDLFYESQKIYLKLGDKVYPVHGKGGLLKLLKDKKQQIRSFIKKNKLMVTKKDPWSLVPVVKFYDTLQN